MEKTDKQDFIQYREDQIMNHISGTVNDAKMCSPLEGVIVKREGANGNVLEQRTTDSLGQWNFACINYDDVVRFWKDGYVKKELSAREISDKIKVRLLENELIGYQEKLWFLPGEKVQVFVHAPQEYTARIFRHGFQKELILDLGYFFTQEQQVPDGHFVEKGLNWKKTIEYTVPNDALPGIYSLLLQSKEGRDFAIPFVVSTPPSHYGIRAKILVLASTTTWQSYNLWGGRNRYRNFEESLTGGVFPTSAAKIIISRVLPENVKKVFKKFIEKQGIETSKWMFKKLSIKRPFTNCNLEEADPFRPFTNHLASGEWRLLAWLEREGYDYDIISGYELHTNPKLLENYKGIILNTHCEYWTHEMFKGLKHFHEQKQGWLLNISGNSIYREIEFFEDGSTRCISLSFKDSCEDEVQVLGVRFTMNDYATCAPYRILKPNHWVFSGVPISESKLFGGLSLNQNCAVYSQDDSFGRPGMQKAGLDGVGASGWETDKVCSSTPCDVEIVAKGLNRKGGADMVVRNPSGKRGGMFSASSLVFSGSLLIDEVCAKVVKNVLNKALEN